MIGEDPPIMLVCRKSRTLRHLLSHFKYLEPDTNLKLNILRWFVTGQVRSIRGRGGAPPCFAQQIFFLKLKLQKIEFI